MGLGLQRNAMTRVLQSLICNCRLESKALQHYAGLVSGEDQWAALQPRRRTERHSAFLFKMATAAACRSQCKFVQLHQTYPYKTFGLLSGMTSLAELRCESERCKQDAWTKSLLGRYHDGLEAPELMLEVYTIALISNIDTAVIEAKHATIRRDVMSRVHANVLKVSRASCAFVMRAVTRPRLITDGLSKRLVSASQEVSSTAEEEPSGRRRGGGGAWRAFVSEKTRGGSGIANTTALALEYSALSGEELARLTQRGAEGMVAHRAGSRAFGLTPSRLRKAQARADRQARLDATRKMLCETARRKAIGDAPEPMLQPAALALPANFGQQEVIQLKKRVQVSAAVEMEAEVRCEDLLAESASGAGSMTSLLPADAKDLTDRLERSAARLPCGVAGLQHFEWQVKGLAKAAGEMCSAANPRDKAIATLMSALEEDWERKHAVIQHDDLTAWKSQRICRQYNELQTGTCFCSDEGNVKWAMGSKLQKVLRTFFGKGKPGRPYMDSGSIAFWFIGEPDEQGGWASRHIKQTRCTMF